MTSKLVMIVDDGLANGTTANIIGLLGISVGHHIPGIVGPDVVDATHGLHLGMSTIGVPVLAADAETLVGLHRDALDQPEITVLDVTDAAIASRDYNLYARWLQDPARDWRPVGLAVTGPKRQVDRLTGRLPLLR